MGSSNSSDAGKTTQTEDPLREYRLLVCGDRGWKDKALIKQVLEQQTRRTPNMVVIHGGCHGADRLAGEAAHELGLRVKEYPADWKLHGKRAGPIRNKRMLEEGKPDFIVAFHDNYADSKGTKDMTEQADRAGVFWVLISHPKNPKHGGFVGREPGGLVFGGGLSND